MTLCDSYELPVSLYDFVATLVFCGAPVLDNQLVCDLWRDW